MATALLFVVLPAFGCGDRCERVCRDVSLRIEQCSPDTWVQLGARNRSDFVQKCRASWDRRSEDLTSSNLNEALRVCGDARTTVEDLSCDELVSLYLP